MNKLSNAIDRFCVKHPYWGIPNLMRFIVIGTVAVYLLYLLTGYNMGIYQLLEPQRGLSPAASPEALPADLIQALLDSNALRRDQAGRLAWCPSVHAPAPLADVKPMGDGDWYE